MFRRFLDALAATFSEAIEEGSRNGAIPEGWDSIEGGGWNADDDVDNRDPSQADCLEREDW